MQIVWKVTNKNMSSIFARGWKVKYSYKKKARPRHGSAEVFAFEDFRSAEEFAIVSVKQCIHQLDYRIFKASATSTRKAPEYIPCDGVFKPNWNEWWLGKKQFNERELMQTPKGSLLCKGVLLIEEVRCS